MDSDHGLESVLRIWLCAKEVFRSLPRKSLKNLRLTCKAVDDVVVDQSHLYQRVYISPFSADLKVLEEISSNNRIAARVTDLIWDVTIEPQFDWENMLSATPSSELPNQAAHIKYEYSKNNRTGQDFQVLLQVLPRFPRLNSVLFTELMGEWYSWSFQADYETLYNSSLLPTRRDLDMYESPAMRAWPVVRLDPPQSLLPYSKESVSEDLVREIETWTKILISAADANTAPPLDISSLRNARSRGPTLFLLALQAMNMELKDFSIAGHANRSLWHYQLLLNHPDFGGIELAALRPLIKERKTIPRVFGPLHRLCLYLDNDPRNPENACWRTDLERVLESAGNLRALELRLQRPEDFSGIRLPVYTHIKTLVLDKFQIRKEVLDGYLLGWSFESGLRTLSLIDCWIVVPNGVTEMDVLSSFIDMDISSRKEGTGNLADINVSMGTRPMTPTTDTTNEHDAFIESDSESSDVNEVLFMDIDFPDPLTPPEYDGYWHSHPEDPDDPEYYPVSQAQWDDNPNTEFVIKDFKSWKSVFEDDYWNRYHREEVAMYDGDYDDDTPDVQEELPIPPVRADVARGFTSAAAESFEFFIDRKGRGGSGGLLGFVVRNFTIPLHLPFLPYSEEGKRFVLYPMQLLDLLIRIEPSLLNLLDSRSNTDSVGGSWRGDCTEYGLVVLDISDLESGVKYGIVAFPMRYMAVVHYHSVEGGWDPVEDDQPLKEPDVVLVSPRPRVPLSISQWLCKYYYWSGLEGDPCILRLQDRPLVDAAALDYIWPPEREVEDQDTDESQLNNLVKMFSQASPPVHFWPSKTNSRIKDGTTTKHLPDMVGFTIDGPKDARITTASPSTTPHRPLRNAHMDRAIDDLLVLTQPADLQLDEKTINNFQKLAEFREQLRERVEEVPDSLGPSEISGYILRVAYAGYSHLNWVAFRNLPLSMIVSAVSSEELQGASTLSLCVDQFKLEGDKGEVDLDNLAAVLAQSTTLKQLCFLQRPDRVSDDASTGFYSELLRLLQASASGGHLEWLRTKTIYLTSAFSTSLRSRIFLASSSTIGPRAVSSVANYFPQYICSHHTRFNAERFAMRFLAYLRSWASGSNFNKTILRFAYNGASSPLTTKGDDHHSPPPWSLPDRFGVSPISARFFDYQLPPNDPSGVRLGDLPPGSWVVLVHSPGQNSDHIQPSASMSRQGPSDDDDDDNGDFLQYSFIRIAEPSAEIAPEQQQQQQQEQQQQQRRRRRRQRPGPVSNNLADVVGGLPDFLRETAPASDIPTWAKQVEELERELELDLDLDARARRVSASPETSKRCTGISVMAESLAESSLAA
ncbi:hypothetical protein BDV12DRAFT_200372 [Aspergillus spectabilis]